MTIRRILVAVDASPASRAAAEAAVELAARLDAELVGIFVEDTELLRLGSLPSVREVSLTTARVRRLESGELTLEVRAQAGRARRLLERAARRRRVRASFLVSRGRVADEVAAASEGADLVALGRIGWSHRRRGYVGRTARSVLARPGQILVLGEAERLAPPIVARYSDDDASKRGLKLAWTLFEQLGGPLLVLLQPDGVGTEVLRRRARADLEATAGDGEIHDVRFVEIAGEGEFLEQAMRACAGALVVPVDPERLSGERFIALLRRLALPVFVVT